VIRRAALHGPLPPHVNPSLRSARATARVTGP
jgi:hypothetical protein